MPSSYMTKSVNVDVDVEIYVPDVVDDLRERGYTVLEPDSDLPEAAVRAVDRAYEAYTNGRLDVLEQALRDLFEAALGRLTAAAPWTTRRAA